MRYVVLVGCAVSLLTACGGGTSSSGRTAAERAADPEPAASPSEVRQPTAPSAAPHARSQREGGTEVLSARCRELLEHGAEPRVRWHDAHVVFSTPIEFETDSREIRRSSDSLVCELAMRILERPGLHLEIQRHTDGPPEEPHGYMRDDLAQDRAESVQQALVRAGVNAARLRAHGYAGHCPVQACEHRGTRWRACYDVNRRIEVHVASGEGGQLGCVDQQPSALAESAARTVSAQETSERVAALPQRCREVLDGRPSRVHWDGERIIFREAIAFEPARAWLRTTSYPVLCELALRLLERPEAHFEIQRHESGPAFTESTYSQQRDLSVERANSLVAALAQCGVPIQRLHAIGYGDRCPVQPCESHDARPACGDRNVRTDVYVVEPGQRIGCVAR